MLLHDNTCDMYIIEARLRNTDVWFDCGFPAEPAAQAAKTAATLNAGDPQFAYRAFLVHGGEQ